MVTLDLLFQAIISKSLLEIAQEKCDHVVITDYGDPGDLEQHDQERKNQVNKKQKIMVMKIGDEKCSFPTEIFQLIIKI